MVKNKTIIKLFEKAGNVGPQPNLVKIIQARYDEMNFNEFKILFMEALCSVFVSDTPMHCSVVNNMIKFAAHSLSVLSKDITKDGQSGMFLLTDFFRICVLKSKCNNKIIRWRFCLFFDHLFNFMSTETALSSEMCEFSTSVILSRLTDKSAEVRVQAVHALHWLQSPDNKKCKIVKQFIFHMTCDPCVEVRASIAKKIAMFNVVVEKMLEYTLTDKNESVRTEAYNRFIEYPFVCLSSQQRQIIVKYGLKDPNKSINYLIKKQLLGKWLENCNNDFEILLKHMDLENVLLCEQIINILFESIYDSQVLELINKYLNSKSRLINFNELTMEKIFLWKCTGKYLTIEKKIALANAEGHEYIEVLLPDLVIFSNYIREYYFNYNPTDSKEFILMQLLDLASIFVMDDVGATSLNILCHDLILDGKTSVKLIQPLTALLNLTFKNGPDIVNYTKQILNEIQTQVVDIIPLMNKVGTQMFLENQIEIRTTQINDILKADSNSKQLRMLLIKLNQIKSEHNNINNLLTNKDKKLVEETVKMLLKSFELVFQIQQMIKVSNERSLMTDIIQNVIVDYMKCSIVDIRMNAIRALAPYLLSNNLNAAKLHINTIFVEISNPMTNMHLMLQILFELFLTYGLKNFDISDDIDADLVCGDFTGENILPLLADSVDYEVDDSSYKTVIVEGFCNLMVFQEFKSIYVISKFIIIWFKRLTSETFNVYQTLMQFFTTYMFHIPSSSSTIAKCYVPVFKQIAKHELINKSSIDLDDMNTTLLNLCQGTIFKDANMAINASSELAGYILDYLLDEDQPYTKILVDSLCKLNINIDKCNHELVSKLKQVINHFKHFETGKTNIKKIRKKFSSILLKEDSEDHGNLFSKENIEYISPIDDKDDDVDVADDDDDEKNKHQCRNLSAIKHMSEDIKKSFNMKNQEQSFSFSK